jgi:ferric-dicitrate binding protein FerR (iron transport regulator)
MEPSNVIPLVQGRQHKHEVLQRQASLWLARLDAGASDDDRRQLGLWLQGDPERAAALFKMVALWDQMEVLRGLANSRPLAHGAVTPHFLVRHGGLALGLGLLCLVLVAGGLWL